MDTITKRAVMERAVEYGANTVTNKEIVSLISGVSTDKIVELIEVYGDLHGALKNARPESGKITKKQATVLNMLSEFHKREIKEGPKSMVIDGPNVVYDLYKREMESYDVEHLFLLALNTKNQILKKVLLSRGVKNGTMFHQAEALKEAIMLNANAVMLIHNHPSGMSNPSGDDITVTKKLMKAGDIMGIKVLDHIVFGRDSFSSIREMIGDQ